MNNYTLSGVIKDMEMKYLHDFRLEPILRFIILRTDVCFEVVCFGEFASLIYKSFAEGESVVVTGELKGYCFEDLNVTGHYCPFLFPVEVRSMELDKKVSGEKMQSINKECAGDWSRFLPKIRILTEKQYSFLINYGNSIMSNYRNNILPGGGVPVD